MKLIFLTRKVDFSDDRVSFVTDWLLEFASNLEQLIVICQEKGNIENLPDNIKILSLGKEKGYTKLYQTHLLKKYFLRNIRSVDGVFSHMAAQFSVIIGGWCRLFNKKLYQWYVHKSINSYLKTSRLYVNGYITANRASFHMKTKRPIHIFGHGINLNHFKNLTPKDQTLLNILSVGRISPTKNIDTLISAIEKFYQNYPKLRNKIFVNIVGGPGLPSQQEYYLELIKNVKDKGLNSIINFTGPLPQSEVFPYYDKSNLFIHLSGTGSVDKVVLEAMAAKNLVISSSEAFKDILPVQLHLEKNDPDLLAKKILEIYNLSPSDKEKLSQELKKEVINNHNLKNLVKKIINLY